MRTLRALVVDDHARIRKLLKAILLEDGTFSEVEEAGDGIEALTLLLEGDFALAIVDVDMPGMDGLALIAEVRRTRPEQAFLVLSALPISEYAARSALLGAAGILPKGCLPATILAAARRASGR